MEVVKLRIGLIEDNLFRYTAQAIKDEGKYFYHIGNKKIEITQKEYNSVIRNPYLYYFSTALKLELEIKKI